MWSLSSIVIMQMILAEDSYLREQMLLIWNSKIKLDVDKDYVFCCSVLLVLEKEYCVIFLL